MLKSKLEHNKLNAINMVLDKIVDDSIVSSIKKDIYKCKNIEFFEKGFAGIFSIDFFTKEMIEFCCEGNKVFYKKYHNNECYYCLSLVNSDERISYNEYYNLDKKRYSRIRVIDNDSGYNYLYHTVLDIDECNNLRSRVDEAYVFDMYSVSKTILIDYDNPKNNSVSCKWYSDSNCFDESALVNEDVGFIDDFDIISLEDYNIWLSNNKKNSNKVMERMND